VQAVVSLGIVGPYCQANVASVTLFIARSRALTALVQETVGGFGGPKTSHADKLTLHHVLWASMKLIVYEAATSNDTPPNENQGTKRDIVIPNSGSAQERCLALFRQFPGYCISFYNTADNLPGWTDVTEDTIDAVSSAVQARRQLRIVRQGK